MEWTPEAWQSAVDALRLCGSPTELFALHDAGAISFLEIEGAAVECCYKNPEYTRELLARLEQDPHENARELAAAVRRLLIDI